MGARGRTNRRRWGFLVGEGGGMPQRGRGGGREWGREGGAEGIGLGGREGGREGVRGCSGYQTLQSKEPNSTSQLTMM